MTPTHFVKPLNLLYTGIIGLVLGVFSFLLWQQEGPNPTSTISLFSWLKSQEVQSLRLELPMDSILLKAEEDLPAQLSWQESWGGAKQLPLEVQVRGNSRKSICDFPPIKLEIDEPVQIDGQWFRAGKYKVVTHCLADSNQERVMKEWLAYRIYEELSPTSFQTHLVEIEYVDSEGKHSPQKAFAFLIENKTELAERLDMELLSDNEPIPYVHSGSYHLFTVFQCLVGNTDWNINKRHNVELLQDSEGRAIPVPYDFDQAGLVNAEYARPHPSLPIDSVTDRYFQWRGKDRDQLRPILELLENHRSLVMGIADATPGLTNAERFRITTYLEGFLDNMEQLLSAKSRLVKVEFPIVQPS
jgi:hypothetical protein